jgi:hypothetical protein
MFHGEKAASDTFGMFTEFCRGIKAQIAWRCSKDWAYFANGYGWMA